MEGLRPRLLAIIAITLLMVPITVSPLANAYQPGDEEAVFGHTFAEEYWTNSSIAITGSSANASFTASYVHVDDFQAFLIAFNRINMSDGKQIIIPYQLFGMHYKTPEEQDVFIGAIFAFLLVHNESYGNNDLPDIGNEDAWYIVPMTNNNPWPEYTPDVEAIPATKISEGHYRFGMRYYNMSARIVSSMSNAGFAASLLFPILTVMISEIVIQYDIVIQNNGEVHVETLYTIGQALKAKWLGLFDIDPADIIKDSMEISAVHYLSVFTSKYNVTTASSGHTLSPPEHTTPLDENLTIRVGDDNERALDIRLGRQYQLLNESTDPWTTVSNNETATVALLGARGGDFLLIAWQAPLSAFLFSHVAYGLSETVRSRYGSVTNLVANATKEFHSSQWWYSVTFPKWNGLRVHQDPTYVAQTNLAQTTSTTTGATITFPKIPTSYLIIGGIVVIVVIALVMKRR
ncbi:MAG: hypothetical protein ACTSVD_01450 [Candidatus Thorarchaeota archaeon]